MDDFKYAEIKQLTARLAQSYNIKCTVHEVKGKPRIYILAKSVETLQHLILSYISVPADKGKSKNNIPIRFCPLFFKDKRPVYRLFNNCLDLSQVRNSYSTSSSENPDSLPIVKYVNADFTKAVKENKL